MRHYLVTDGSGVFRMPHDPAGLIDNLERRTQKRGWLVRVVGEDVQAVMPVGGTTMSPHTAEGKCRALSRAARGNARRADGRGRFKCPRSRGA